MLKRVLILVALCCQVAYPMDTSPSDASIKELLEVAQARKLLDTLMSQMDTIMKNAMQTATQGQPVPPDVQKIFDRCCADVVSTMQEQFTWDKLEPMYIRIYKKSLSQQEVDGMIAFYRTPTGQAVLTKMPAIMENSMNEVMQMMGPMMQRIERMQRDVIAEIQAKKTKKGSS